MALPKTNKMWVLAARPEGVPTNETFKLVEQPLPADLKDGQFIVKLAFVSVDPYMRGMISRLPLGAPIVGGSAGHVVKSANPKFVEGTAVVGQFGWALYAVSDGKGVTAVPKEYPLSMTLGALGMPGATAYFGLLELCRPKPGETVFVTGAAGAVGSLVGQIAKSLGCKVIGSAGGAAKCKWCLELGFDAMVDYANKSAEQLLAELKAAAPQGIDAFFENTGGPMSDAVMLSLNPFARVAVCGLISQYNSSGREAGVLFPVSCIYKQVKMESFIVTRWSMDKWPEAHKKIFELMTAKKLVAREEIVHGFDNIVHAFLGLFAGKNTGKMVVQLD